MSNFEIAADVPLPPRANIGARKYPYADLVVGHSFHVPLVDGEDVRKLQRRMAGSSTAAGKRLGFKFASRAVDNGVRIWRTA